jgi:hypothetical protein
MIATVTRSMGLTLLLLPSSLAYQTGSARLQVNEAALRADASVYPVPEYPVASIQANHTGRVVIEVAVAPASRTSPLARVHSTKVVETPKSVWPNGSISDEVLHPLLGSYAVWLPDLNRVTTYSDWRSAKASTDRVVVLSVQLRKMLASQA